jgi:hypothetical protein
MRMCPSQTLLRIRLQGRCLFGCFYLLATVLGVCLTTDAGAQQGDILLRMYTRHQEVRQPDLEGRYISHRRVLQAVEALKADPAFVVTEAGRSVEGRAIPLVRWGEGPIQVLLWSQMHGDEPTSTRSIIDLWAAMQKPAFLPELETWRKAFTLHFLPLLNPDGAERFQRVNALGIDLNRDALRLTSPEARILKHLRDSLDADWGFNLHDQHRYYTTGWTDRPAAIAFLAPPQDTRNTIPPHRRDAMRLIVGLNASLQKLIPNQVARYTDGFEKRAFGDNFTLWGTRTVLIEAGWLTGDDDKQALRRIYFSTLAAALDAIATQRYAVEDDLLYPKIPLNQNRLSDLLIREAILRHSGEEYLVDLSFKLMETVTPSGATWHQASIVEMGDLHTHVAHEVLEAAGMRIEPAKAYGHVLTDPKDLIDVPVKELVESGIAVIRMLGIKTPDKHLDLPIALRHPDDDASELVYLSMNPVFYLVDGDGRRRYLVNNGRVWNLRESAWREAIFQYLARGLD